MKQISIFSLLSALIFSILAAGCKPNDNDKPKSTRWLEKLRQEIRLAETPFFSSSYMQNDTDPFYLDEIAATIVKAKGALSNSDKEHLSYAKNNIEETWKLLTTRLNNLQKLYAITASISAYELDELMGKIFTFPDFETKALFITFEKLLEDDSIYDSEQKRFKKSALKKGFELSQKIQERVLARAKSVNMANLPDSTQRTLKSLQNTIMDLNPSLAMKLGSRNSGDPKTTWDALYGYYQGVLSIFGVAQAVLDAGAPSFSLDWASLKKNEHQLLRTLKKDTELQHTTAAQVVGPEIEEEEME